MREKIEPWMPAIFCVCLTLITIVHGFTQAAYFQQAAESVRKNGGTPPPPVYLMIGVLIPFLCFLPMCFLFVGNSISQLRRENRELRDQIQEVMAKSGRANAISPSIPT